MSGAVHYKFKSANNFDSVTFDGHYISVADLKREIVKKKNLTVGNFDLLVYNEQTGEEYKDTSFMVPKNTSVTIKRVPASQTDPQLNSSLRPSWGSVPNSGDFGGDVFQPRKADSQSKPRDEESMLTDLMTKGVSDWDSDKRPAQRFSGGKAYVSPLSVFGSKRDAMPPAPKYPPPAGHVCARCNQPGHWIQNCPTWGDPNYDHNKIRPATGIPRSMLQRVVAGTNKSGLLLEDGTVARLAPNEDLFARAMRRPAGRMPPRSDRERDRDRDAAAGGRGGAAAGAGERAASRSPRSSRSPSAGGGDAEGGAGPAAAAAAPAAAPLGSPKAADIPAHLNCPICHGLMREAVLIPCCGTSFCDQCVREVLITDKLRRCPVCRKPNMTPGELIANRTVRNAVDRLRQQSVEAGLGSGAAAAASTAAAGGDAMGRARGRARPSGRGGGSAGADQHHRRDAQGGGARDAGGRVPLIAGVGLPPEVAARIAEQGVDGAAPGLSPRRRSRTPPPPPPRDDRGDGGWSGGRRREREQWEREREREMERERERERERGRYDEHRRPAREGEHASERRRGYYRPSEAPARDTGYGRDTGGRDRDRDSRDRERDSWERERGRGAEAPLAEEAEAHRHKRRRRRRR